MKLADLSLFVALDAAGLHFPRAAAARGTSLPALYAAFDRLEAEVGHPLIDRSGQAWRLTPAGQLLLEEARARIAEAPASTPVSAAPAGGKAKASKGTGRAPIVKGQPKPYKKRQGR